MAWIAILVVVDNCTRQSLGLPLFITGAKVTAEMVVEALRQLLPAVRRSRPLFFAELQFLISDRGPQFTADLMKQRRSQTLFTWSLPVIVRNPTGLQNGLFGL